LAGADVHVVGKRGRKAVVLGGVWAVGVRAVDVVRWVRVKFLEIGEIVGGQTRNQVLDEGEEFFVGGNVAGGVVFCFVDNVGGDGRDAVELFVDSGCRACLFKERAASRGLEWPRDGVF